MSITREELNQNIKEIVKKLLDTEIKQYFIKYQALEQLIEEAELSKINMHTTRMKSHKQALYSGYKNEAIEISINYYKEEIKKIRIKLQHIKKFRIELLKKSSTFMNRLKEALEGSTKAKKSLKVILCNANQNYTYWLVSLCYYLLQNEGTNHTEVKQRMNLLLEEILEDANIKATDNQINDISYIVIANILNIKTDKRVRHNKLLTTIRDENNNEVIIKPLHEL